MGRKNGAVGGADLREFFHGQSHAHAVASTAAQLFGNDQTKDAEFGHAPDRLLGETMVLVPFRGDGLDFVLGEFPNHVLDQFLFFGKNVHFVPPG